MRIVKVEFQRLLGFKDVSIELEPRLQLIAGPNNAGKSTLVRLLETFFSNPTKQTLLDLKPLNAYYAGEGRRTLSRITVHMGNLSVEERGTFSSILRRNGTFSISLRASRSGFISFDASKKPGTDEARALYEEVLDRFRFVKIPSIRVADGRFNEPDSLERLLDTLEAVLVRTGNVRSTTLQQQYGDKMAPVEALVREVLDRSAASIMNDLPFRESYVKFRLPEARHALRGMLSAAVIESEDEVSLPVSERGTGFQSALVLGILRYVAEQERQGDGNLMFAIEEPEAFLHPQTQRAMAKIIRDISVDAQVLVTTHSSVIVDSFSIEQIARLPLRTDGLEHRWGHRDLEPTDVGRLSRYCSASNGELIFANAVIFVEGEGDFATLEKLLGRLCGAPGGHYALGITVIEATGVAKIRYLVQLAEMFGVRSYVLVDRDALHKTNGERQLLKILKNRADKPNPEDLSRLSQYSDIHVENLTTALKQQEQLNQILGTYDAFVLAADLEGLLLDLYGTNALVAALGPEGYREIDASFANELLTDGNGREQLAKWLGSKGWNSTGAKTGKLAPHLPALLVEDWLEKHDSPGPALKPLIDWLSQIIETANLTPV